MHWSFSSLDQFNTCAKMYYLQRVSKQIVSAATEATVEGERVHLALELRVRDGKPLPKDLSRLENLCQTLAASNGEVYTEFEMALNRDLKPVSMDAPGAWCRGIADVLIVGENNLVGLDWKTGKPKPPSWQLELMAAMAFAHFPGKVKCKTGYVWLKTNEVVPQTFLAADLPKIWEGIISRVVRLEQAYEKDKWTPRPSGLCAGWCGAGRNLCEFWSPKRSRR